MPISGCVEIPNNNYFPEDNDTVKIIVGYENNFKEYTTNVTTEMLGKHLDRVVVENSLHVVFWNEQTDDRFLVELDTLQPNMQNGEYIFVMANIDNPFWTGGMNLSVNYNGETFYDINYGFDKMPILDDVSYLFTIIKY
ncbi:MAG: hypothetical protein FWF56_06680 [Firmicutes bacterium]|nr:hypothetical protein [Bacillota bacterium]MCL1953149.1 hypothetical protein [Bacillota bacterium]